jgi:predicted nucleic acid-binding protein
MNSYLITSFMTRVELLSLFDIDDKIEERIINFFSIIPIVPYSQEIEDYAIQIQRNSHLKIPDAFIAAPALAQDAILITNDHQLLKIK